VAGCPGAGAREPRIPPHAAPRCCRKPYDLSIPENQGKLDAADAPSRVADEAGMSLVELALAFVRRHPAVTTAIIGPRMMELFESSCVPLISSFRTTCSTGPMRSCRPA
jgi:Aldo/keto reductase family